MLFGCSFIYTIVLLLLLLDILLALGTADYLW